MKKLLFILLLLPFAAMAQQKKVQLDNPKWMNETTEDVEVIKLNLVRSYERHKDGTALYIGGIVLGAAAYVIYNNGGEGPGNGMGIVAGAMFTAGFVIHMDAHKFLGRAGRGKK